MPTIKQSTANDNQQPSGIPEQLTIAPLRDVVLYPNMVYPTLIGRPSTLKAVAEAIERNKYIFVAAQKDSTVDDPSIKHIHKYGAVAKIMQVLRLPNNLLKVLLEGVHHGKIVRPVKNSGCLEAKIEVLKPNYEMDKELAAMVRRSGALFTEYVKENRNLPGELLSAFENIDDPIKKLYFAAANITQKVDKKQLILEKTQLKKQYFELISLLSGELELLKIEEELETKVHDAINKTQKKYFIQEQIRALQSELEDDDETMPETSVLKKAIDEAGMPPAALEKAMEEFDKFKRTSPMFPEHGVIRSYLETLTSLPWSFATKDDLNIEHVKQILDEDHYDLEKPKDRILEYIAVLNVNERTKGQILCLCGPPGVGKTSLGRSIARALGRKFTRVSLGGVRDEAEIRGHRRTYIGSMPGKILQSMKKAGSINPVILLDEVDKMSADFRGDPSSALLEVLDPEQNSTFNDHYLEVDYDLSNVIFITTANVKYDIPAPLLDRMEVIEIGSYMEDAKLEIVKRHIIPKSKKEFGLENLSLAISDSVILKLIREYTREAGVRNIEREINSLLRKFTRELVFAASAENIKINKKKKSKEETISFPEIFSRYIAEKQFTIAEDDVVRLMKHGKFRAKNHSLENKIGVATGLAWTSMGGDILPVEATIMPGTDKLTLTGKLGDVMKESAMAALSYIRSHWELLNVPEDFSKGKEIHIHVPEGAIPKDGPSAGITMTLAIISAASGRSIRGDLAMTGEVTLNGNVLPIGGLNEKLLAAKREGITTVFIPHDNQTDLQEISQVILDGLTIIPVKHILEAVPHAFVVQNGAKTGKAKTTATSKK